MTQKLFRQEVIEAGRERLTGDIIIASPPSARLYTLLVAGTCVGMLLLLSIGQYDSRTQIRGIVAHDRGTVRVYPPGPAEVSEVHVTDNLKVGRGAALVTVSLAQGRDSEGEGIDSQLARIAEQDAALARQLSLTSRLGSSETATLIQRKAGLIQSIASLERQRGLIAGQIALAESDSKRAARLATEGAGSQRQVEERRATALQRRLDLESLNERIISQREALREIDGLVMSRMISGSQTETEIATRRAALAEERARLIRSDRLTLTAPVSGLISGIEARIGQRANADSSLITIVPANSRLEVQLYAPSRAVGFVKPGQRVRLQFDAFPYQKYGIGSGRVISISDIAIDPAAVDKSLGITEPVFRIRVAIDNAGPKIAGRPQPLRAGMTLSAALLLEQRSLWSVFFDPIISAVRA
jgi:membrane fusion protein